jgi:hypothetical protein
MDREKVIQEALRLYPEDARMKEQEFRWILEHLDKVYKGGNSLEIGAYKGMTSYVLAAYLKEHGDHVKSDYPRKHYVVDEFSQHRGDNNSDTEWKYQEHTRQMLIDNLGEYADFAEVIEGKSLSDEVLGIILRQKFDYVWIDGDHRFGTLMGELLVADAITNNIFGHDYGHPGVTEAVDKFCEVRGYKLNRWSDEWGLFHIEKTVPVVTDTTTFVRLDDA